MVDQRSTNARVMPSWLRALELLLSGDGTLVWGMLFSAWGIVFIAVLTGNGNWLHGDTLATHPYWGIGTNLLTFIFAWLVMTVAMMLPTSLPLIQLFAKVKREQKAEHWEAQLLLFVVAYLTVWSVFALITFLGDFLLHRFVDSRPWLIQHSSWFTGMTLLLAGAFQFSGLKERCLRVCRHPYGFLSQHYRRGTRAAWDLGLHHGLYCLGCCWTLMLVMFSVGVAHLAGMLILTAVMAVEKTSPWGRTLVPVFGIILLVWGGLTLVLGDTPTAILTSSRCSGW
jgi:predicted metal-binding membrane protein